MERRESWRIWRYFMTPFEEVMWLFSSNKSSRGICRLNIGEAALLYKYSKLKKDSHFLEIGRKFGGSTVVMASAIDGGHITSIDIVAHKQAIDNTESFKDKITFITSNSKHVKWVQPLGLLFIDGDHNPVSVKGDVKRFSSSVEQGGYMAFHDATKGSINKIIQKIVKAGKWIKKEQVNSMVVLQRL